MTEIKRFYQQKVIIKNKNKNKNNTNKTAKLKTKKNKFSKKHITKISSQVSSAFVNHFEANFRSKFKLISFTI